MLVAAVSICGVDLLKVSVLVLAEAHVNQRGAAVHVRRVKVVKIVILRFIPLFPFDFSSFSRLLFIPSFNPLFPPTA